MLQRCLYQDQVCVCCEAGRRRRAHRLEDEHAVVGVQQLGDEELEELLLDAARVNALLADEVHAQRLEQVLRPLPRYLVQRVLQ